MWRGCQRAISSRISWAKSKPTRKCKAYYPHMKQSMQEYRNSINRGTVEVVLHSRADIAVLCYAIRFRRFFFLHCGMEESDLLSIYLSYWQFYHQEVYGNNVPACIPVFLLKTAVVFHGQYALYLHEGISICVYISNKQKERDIFSHCLDIF